MSGKEIISVQCGNFSNYIGSHWWNFHESNCYSSFAPKGIFNYDILFHQGENLKREVTYTPRLMIIDAKGSLGYLSPFGHQLYQSHYDEATAPGDVTSMTSSNEYACWDGKVEIVDQSGGTTMARDKNDFLRALEGEFDGGGNANGDKTSGTQNRFEGINGNSGVAGSSQGGDHHMDLEENHVSSFREQIFDLNDQVHSWSDYMKALLHPKTINIINEYEIKSDEQEARSDFGSFSAGSEYFKNHLDELESNCFYLIEKCDNTQGFNVLSDAYDGVLAAVALNLLTFLNDEFPKKTILSFPSCEPLNNKQVEKCYGELCVSSLLTLNSSLNFAQTVTPLSLANDWLSWQCQPNWMAHLYSDWFTTTSKCSSKYEQSALLALAYHSSLAPLYCADDQFMPLYFFSQLMTPSQRRVLCISSNFGRFSSSQPSYNEASLVFGCCSPSKINLSSIGDSPRCRPLASMNCLWNNNNASNSPFLPSTREQAWCDCLLKQPISNCCFHIGEGILLEPPFPRMFSNKRSAEGAKMNLSIFSAVSNSDMSSSILQQLLKKVCSDSNGVKLNRRVSSACSKMNLDQDFVSEAIEAVNTQLGHYNDDS